MPAMKAIEKNLKITPGFAGRLTRLLSAIVLCAASHAIFAADFYCDPVKGTANGDGSTQRPWRTIEEVLKAKLVQLADKDGRVSNPAAPVKSGDTIFLRSGWHGVIRIPTGFNSDWITICAEAGHRPQVGFVDIGQGRKWRLRGLTISPSLAPNPLEKPPKNLVSLGEHGDEASAELVIEDCFIFTSLDTTGWSAKDWIEKTYSGIWLGRHGQGHVARNNYVLNTRFGINLCAPQVICEGNVVANFSADGIRVTRDGQIVQYNVIKNVFVGSQDGDDNHDDGIQAFLFNRGRGTLRDVVVRGNLIVARENDRLPWPNGLQGIGFFDGPLVHFTVEENVVLVNHYHGVSLYDAQGCTIRSNACFSRWSDRAKPWVMLGQKIRQAQGNIVRDNMAHSFSFKADSEVQAANNQTVTEAIFREKMTNLLAVIENKFGKLHPVANRPRLELEWTASTAPGVKK